MATKARIFLSASHDPWFNLATEDWIFNGMGDAEQVLFLWRNQETVVIGRSQNPWLECHLERMQKNDICLARRQSGGGAVFHDLGNTNFTFLSEKSVYSRAANFNIIVRALQRLSIEADVSGRNDLVVRDVDGGIRKISGSAFRENQHRAFHHGTLLVDANLNKLSDCLNPDKKKLASKGIKSVRSRVMNLSEIKPSITHDDLCQAIIAEFLCSHHLAEGDCMIETLQVDRLQQMPSLTEFYQKMRAWDWVYGQTLHFTHRFTQRLSWGMVDIHLEVDGAVIVNAKIYSDSLFPDLIESVESHLKGCQYQVSVINEVLSQLQLKKPLFHTEMEELKQWLLRELV